MKVHFILTAGFWSENNLLHFFLSSPPPSCCVCTQVWACLCNPRDPACPGAVTPPIGEAAAFWALCCWPGLAHLVPCPRCSYYSFPVSPSHLCSDADSSPGPAGPFFS